MTTKVYSKPGCVQCNATYRALDKKGINYEVVDMSKDADALDLVLSRGHLQAPVMIVFNADGSIHESWDGFRPDKIEDFTPVLAKAA
ncbi:NrdH-redoxin (plasmid) [Citricoccus nitrophenolicus]